MKLVFIIVEDEQRIYMDEDFEEALLQFIRSVDRVRKMNGDIEASLTAAWIDE